MKKIIFVLLLLVFFKVNAALAYVGPGAGLSAIGSIMAFLGSIMLLIAGFVWYPIKRLVRGRGKRGKKS